MSAVTAEGGGGTFWGGHSTGHWGRGGTLMVLSYGSYVRVVILIFSLSLLSMGVCHCGKGGAFRVLMLLLKSVRVP